MFKPTFRYSPETYKKYKKSNIGPDFENRTFSKAFLND